MHRKMHIIAVGNMSSNRVGYRMDMLQGDMDTTGKNVLSDDK